MDQFETAQRWMRAALVQVLNDTASGQDVRAEYVDTHGWTLLWHGSNPM